MDSKTSKPSRRGRVLLYTLQIIALVIALGFFTRNVFPSKSTPTPPPAPPYAFNPHKPYDPSDWKQPQAQHLSCLNTTSTFTTSLSHNLTSSNLYSWSLTDSSPTPPNNATLRGEISVQKGTIHQAADIHIVITARSTHPVDPGTLDVIVSPSGISIAYTPSQDQSCTTLHILILLRPTPTRHMHALTLRTRILDISIQDTLAWEIDTLSTHTSHGTLTFDDPHSTWSKPLIIHTFIASSLTGYLFAALAAHGQIILRNEQGGIGVPLLPRNSGPFRLERLQLSTRSGAIRTEMYARKWPAPARAFDHIVQIHSASGAIEAGVPHGVFSYVSSVSADVLVGLFPSGGIYNSEIYTYSQRGSTWFRLWDVLPQWGEGALGQMLSAHRVGVGELRVKYPAEWFGMLVGRVGEGSVEVEGEGLVGVERGEGWMRARRGEGGMGVLLGEVGRGGMSVRVGVGLRE